MDVTRREMAGEGGDVLAPPRLLLGGVLPPRAASPPPARSTQTGPASRGGLFEADKARLDQVAAAQISYGHSDGRVETKEQFINGVMTRKQTVKSLAFPELKVSVVGDAAIARHIYLAESELDGKQTTTK